MRPLVEETLVKRSTNEKSVVEGSVTEDTFNKKLELINFWVNFSIGITLVDLHLS